MTTTPVVHAETINFVLLIQWAKRPVGRTCRANDDGRPGPLLLHLRGVCTKKRSCTEIGRKKQICRVASQVYVIMGYSRHPACAEAIHFRCYYYAHRRCTAVCTAGCRAFSKPNEIYTPRCRSEWWFNVVQENIANGLTTPQLVRLSTY